MAEMVLAACTACGREFKVPLRALARVKDAQANLQEQFDRSTDTNARRRSPLRVDGEIPDVLGKL